MSLASTPDCLFRPEDKALKMLFPSIEETIPNSFDDFLNGDLYGLSDDDNTKETADDFFERGKLASGIEPLLPIGDTARQDTDTPQPWRKGLWCLNQGRGSSGLVVEKRRDNEYRNHEAVSRTAPRLQASRPRLNPRSPPATPSQRGTKNRVTSPRTAQSGRAQYSRQPFLREVTLSPSPMYAQLQHNGKLSYPEAWQQDFQNFHLKLPQELLPLSPPLSGGLPHIEASARHLNAAVIAHNASAAHYVPQSPHHVSAQLKAQYHAVDPSILDPNLAAHGLPLPASPNEQMLLPSQHYGQPPIPVWVTEDLASSSSSHESYDIPADMTSSSHIHSWWSPPMNHGPPQVPVQHHDYYSHIAAPKPQRAPHQILQQPSEMHNGGLGIHYPEMAHAAPPEPSLNTSAFSPSSNPTTSYPPLPPPNHHFMLTDPFGTPRRQRQRSPSRSPSPSVSPTNTTRTLRQRSPTRTDYNHHRRKSIHKAGPIKDKENSCKPPRTPKTPKTPTGDCASLAFVNFTPKDSAKLLSDVAPSGSSKTRARREQEAKEKRKRLSEAAVKAVRRAGGDIRALEGAILS